MHYDYDDNDYYDDDIDEQLDAECGITPFDRWCQDQRNRICQAIADPIMREIALIRFNHSVGLT